MMIKLKTKIYNDIMKLKTECMDDVKNYKDMQLKINENIIDHDIDIDMAKILNDINNIKNIINESDLTLDEMINLYNETHMNILKLEKYNENKKMDIVNL